MSANARIDPGPRARPGAGAGPGAGAAPGWEIRGARLGDAVEIVAAVRDLLVELGGTPPDAAAMQAATRTLIKDDSTGAMLVADAGGGLVGVLAASWQTAIHVPGRYALIQDLWVQPSWRRNAVGHELLGALSLLAREQGVACVEVGLPRGRFAGLPATEAFYRANGFHALGTRMRRVLG
jgi:GNAT superfamily N-acetyltransferase